MHASPIRSPRLVVTGGAERAQFGVGPGLLVSPTEGLAIFPYGCVSTNESRMAEAVMQARSPPPLSAET